MVARTEPAKWAHFSVSPSAIHNCTRSAHSSGLQLRLRVDGGALPDGLSAKLVARDGALFTLRLASARELEEVLARLRESGTSIVELDVQPPDLEEVFLRLTGRAS